MEMRLGYEWRHARKRWSGILGDFEKKSINWDLSLGEASSDSDLGEASPVMVYRMHRAFVGSVSWDLNLGEGSSAGELTKGRCRNSQHSKNCVSLSPRVEKLKVKKGNKRFVPELPRVVSVSQDSYACEHFTYSFANGPGDVGSIPGRVIPKTQKMVLDASLLNTQHYKVRIKGKVEQSREGVAPLPYTLV